MSRNKLKKFQVCAESKRVIEPEKENYLTIKGNWNKEHFKNDNPIVLELACGRGEYSTGLGKVFPEKNFIGVDVKGDRIWYGNQVAEEFGLDNVAFLRCQIHTLESFFAEEEVSEIWIVHPDPRPRNRDMRRRLTFPRYLNLYKNILKKDGIVRLKTDSAPLYKYTLEVIKQEKLTLLSATDDLENSELLAEHHGIETKYGKMFIAQGHKIHYLTFKF